MSTHGSFIYAGFPPWEVLEASSSTPAAFSCIIPCQLVCSGDIWSPPYSSGNATLLQVTERLIFQAMDVSLLLDVQATGEDPLLITPAGFTPQCNHRTWEPTGPFCLMH